MTHETHYSRLASAFESNWAYTPAFVAAMTAQIVSAVALADTDTVVDLGGGTGLFARQLALELKHEVYCVDPSAAMLAQVDRADRVIPVHGSAEDYACGCLVEVPRQVDVVVVKEAVHHFAAPATTIGRLTQRLKPGGRMLIAMLPTRIEYPLFGEALRRFTGGQPDPAAIAAAAREANFDVSTTTVTFPLSFAKDRYLRMVRDRYMSVLSTFTDEELAAGIKEIDEVYPEQLRFADRFVFIVARKKRDAGLRRPRIPMSRLSSLAG